MRKGLLLFGSVLLMLVWANAQRLPNLAVPENYKLTFAPDFGKENFSGDETIRLNLVKPTSQVVLNAVDIDFQDVSISSKGKTQKATVSVDKGKQWATLSVEKQIEPGTATVHIRYVGILNHELRGLYVGDDGQGHKYALTQFEATDARRAFPSFDEPAYKATFDITIIADKGMTALSNARAVSDTPGPEDKHTVRFATSAKMSSYLAAIAVGNFEYIEGSADGIPIRVYSMPGKKDLSKFALEASESCLRYFDKYFGIRYPYGKLDLIGVRDFSAGAMENVGLITFREVLLQLDDQHASVNQKKAVGITISHEIAHQWFGDLVTTQWWDDIWLNEGFATWMEGKPIDDWKPEWNVLLDEVSRGDVTSTLGALNVDSLASTRSIHQPAETPDQIGELFDGIAYGKAAAVLRMLEAYLGPEVFRAGVREYVKQHAEGNATADDFWTTLARVSKQPVDQIMPTFVKQPGVPMISIKTKCSGDSTQISLSQQRYFSDRASFNKGSDQLWQVPVCLRNGSETADARHCELLTKQEDAFTLPGCSSWVLANAGASGYYRSSYQPEVIQGLSGSAESSLSPAERVILLVDTWAAVRVGRASVGDYLALAQGLQNEPSSAVLGLALNQIGFVGHYLVNDRDKESYASWVRSFLTPVAQRVGWESRPGENGDQTSLRANLLAVLGDVGRDPEAIAEARKLSEQVLQNPDSVNSDVAGSALAVAAASGDSAFYDRIMAGTKTSRTPEQYYLYFFSLSGFSDPQLLQRTLDFALSHDVRSQDALFLIGSVMGNRAGERLAWDFVRSHWAEVEKVGGAFASGQIVGSAGNFCDAELRNEVNEFFSSHKVAAAERTFRQSMERIGNCVDLKTQQTGQLASWLHGAGAGTAEGSSVQ